MIRLEESRIDDDLCETLIAFSKDWEKEDISYGYIANGPEEFAGKRIFIAKDEEKTVAYLFGHEGKAESMASAIGKGSRCFPQLFREFRRAVILRQLPDPGHHIPRRSV